METILISACLVGDKVRYDGKGKYNPLVKEILQKYNLIPFCPEVEGGLKTPRPRSEKLKDKIINEKGDDVSSFFKLGAKKGLNILYYTHIKKVILQDRSPSCGINEIHDGSFSNKLVKGEGVFTKLLRENGFEVYTIEDFYTKFINEEKKEGEINE